MAAPVTPQGSSPASPAPRAVLAVVFVTILIDFVGFTVLIPVLPLYAEQLGASELQVALILTVYALAQLVFLPAWGWVSDRVGRRPVILVSLLGTVVSFSMLAFADSIGGIYLARVLAGFFAASIGTAQAVVTDVTSKHDRAGGMGLIGAAFGIGMVLGPVIGGLTAEIDVKAPFYSVALLAAVNLAVAWVRLPETRPPRPMRPEWAEFARTLVPTPVRLLLVVHDRAVALFLYLFFHITSAFAVLEALFTLYIGKRFDRGPLDVGLLFMWIGVVLALTQGLLLRRLVSRWGERRLVMAGLVAMGAGLASLPWLPSFAWFYPLGGVIAFGNGITFPSFTSLYTRVCAAGSAGELLGHSQAMGTTGRIAGPTVGGLLMGYSLGMPFVVAGALMFAALAIFVAFGNTMGADTEGQDDADTGANPTPGALG